MHSVMKRFCIIVSLLLAAGTLFAQSPSDKLDLSRTLRVDYIFTGTDKTCDISVDELRSLSGWAGRRVNMQEVPVMGNGAAFMRDTSGQVLYATSFSTLFQEWQATEEATRLRKSFENVFLFPMPAEPVDITVELYDFFNNVAATYTHRVQPSDILIRPASSKVEYKYIGESGSPEERIDVAIVAEGYTEQEMDVFYADAQSAVEVLLSHSPFKDYADKFNFIAVALPSKDSGVSIPKQGLWKNTALSSNFDTFYMDRYLTTLRLRDLHDELAGVPYEHIVILANTDNYGGGGIYNSYTLTTAHNKWFKEVVVHEFGHSFGALADEYYYDDMFVEYYYPNVEPWERNITTKADFSSKWEKMMGKNGVGLVEGGGYQSKGVWRACEDCRMKSNKAPDFCPVCQKAIEDMILFYTKSLK